MNKGHKLKTFLVDEIPMKAYTRKEAMSDALGKFRTGFGNMKAEVLHCKQVKK